MAPHFPRGIVREIYSRKPDWWARWTWPMVLGIAVWTAIGAENIYNHWTQKVEIKDVTPVKKNDTAAELPNSEPGSVHWELRPFRQRALMSASILVFGTGLGILFINGRSRIVRRLHGVYFPAPVNGPVNSNKILSPVDLRYLVVETLGGFSPGKGKVYPREKCQLIRGKDDSEMRLKVQDAFNFWLGLDGAVIQGNQVAGGTFVVREKLLQSIGQGSKTGRWRSGPVIEPGL